MKHRLKPWDVSPTVLGFLVFLFPFLIYLYTLAPSITLEDSGELVTAAATLGIAHPSGYPLFAFLGKLFTLLPFGDVTWTAWKVNLMSAFFAGLTGTLITFILQHLSVRPFIAVTGAWIAAFSKIFWSQSVIAEVYTLHAFLFFLCLYLLLLWKKEGSARYLLWFSFIYGLSLTNHNVGILYAPFFLLFIFFTQNLFKTWRLLLACLGLSLVGLSFYLYIPIRMGATDILNFGNIQTWSEALNHIGRTYYKTLDFGYTISLSERWSSLVFFLKSLTEQFGAGVWLLGLIGLPLLFRKQKLLSVTLVGIFLMGSVGLIFIRNFHDTPQIMYATRVFFINSYLIFALSIAFGLHWITQRMTVKPALVLGSLLFVVPLLSNFTFNNQRHNDFAYRHGMSLLETLPQDAFLVGISTDDVVFPLTYLHYVEKVRPDVTLLDVHGGIFRKINNTDVCQPCPNSVTDARVFAKKADTFLKDVKREKIFFVSRPSNPGVPYFDYGLLYSMVPHPAPIDFDTQYGDILNFPLSGHDFQANRVQAYYRVRKGETLYRQSHVALGLKTFEKAVSLQDDPLIAYWVGDFLMEQNLNEKAYAYFEKAIAIHPYFSSAHNSLGKLDMINGKGDAAIQHFYQAITYSAFHQEQFLFNLAFAELEQGALTQAYNNFKTVLSKKPQHYKATYYLSKVAHRLGYHQEAVRLLRGLQQALPAQAKRFDKIIANIERQK